MSRPKLKEIDELFDLGMNFSLTEKQYKEKTGLNFPQKTSYFLHDSAVAKRAEMKGYKLVLSERTVIFEKDDKTA